MGGGSSDASAEFSERFQALVGTMPWSLFGNRFSRRLRLSVKLLFGICKKIPVSFVSV